MFINTGAVKNSRKRKMEKETTTDDLTLPFTSFISLLLEDNDNDDDQHQIPNTHLPDQQINQIITTHCDSLRRTLADYTALRRGAEERAAKRMREKQAELEERQRSNEELERRVALFKKEAQLWEARARVMEDKVESLRELLIDTRMRGGCTDWRERLKYAGCVGLRVEVEEEEDAASSYVDPEGRGGEVTWQGGCKACGKLVATVMMWPCRHVSTCVGCEGATKACPVCLSPKTASVEVRLP